MLNITKTGSDLLELLVQVLLDPNKSIEEKRDTVKTAYAGVAETFRPVLASVLPTLLEEMVPDLTFVATQAINASNAIRNEEGLRKALAESGRIKARARMELLKTYMGEGFTRQEAMALLLQDIANTDANIKASFANLSKTSSGQRAAKSSA